MINFKDNLQKMTHQIQNDNNYMFKNILFSILNSHLLTSKNIMLLHYLFYIHAFFNFHIILSYLICYNFICLLHNH